MDPSTSDIILEEVRELRTVVVDAKQEIGERLATVETHLYGLVGNGQPGKISDIEDDIKELQRFKYWLLGSAATVSASAHVAWHWITGR